MKKLISLTIDTEGRSRRSLAVLPSLRLKRLFLSIDRRDDVKFLNRCAPLERLEVRKWPGADLSDMRDVVCENLVVVSRKLESPRGVNCSRLSDAHFAYCPNLRKLDGLRVPKLKLESCKKLPLEELTRVAGLRDVHIISHSKVESFEFVLGCPQLEEMTFAATRIAARNVSPLIESMSLRKVAMYTCRDALIAQAGRANAKLDIRNENIRYSGGRQVSPE